MDFTCNICGTKNTGVESFGREVDNCSGCHSSVRIRAVMYAFSQELFGTPLQLSDFPVLKGIRGLGMTDCDSYARVLAERFAYENTFLDTAPILDIMHPEGWEQDAYNFLISSEVFEHVSPPWEKALANALRLLRPDGLLIMTAPYSLREVPQEHYPQLSDYGLVKLRGGHVLVNRTASGELQVFDDLVFHGGPGSTLEMRVLNETELKRGLRSAGFEEVHLYGENYAPFGVIHEHPWSVPVAARKAPFGFSATVRAELMRQFGQNSQQLRRHVEENTSLVKELESRAAWALALDQEIHQARRIIERLDAELEERTDWAKGLDKQLGERTEWAKSLETEVEARTKWARELERQLEQQKQRIAELESQSSRARMRNQLKKAVKRVVRGA